MPLIIPNANDTTGGNKYVALDQAEPDSLDIEIAGNVGRSGVVSGLGVTSNSSTTTVNVAAGVIALNGAAYTVAASPTYSLPAAPVNSRFDLIIARVTAGSASLVTVSGTDSATNPTFPKSRNVITVAYNNTLHVDLDTDVVVAAVFRSGSSTITTSRIADKRTLQTSGITTQGTAVPNSGVGSGPGNLYFKSNTTNAEGTVSGVYVRLADGTWVGLAKDVGLHTPVGAALLWPSKAAVPSNFLEANGQSLNTTTYATLYGLYSYDHGGSGGTFLLPDFNNKYVRGTTNTALIGTTTGSDTFTLTVAQLPPHDHPNTHTHTHVHTHDISHGHTATTTADGAHQHSPGSLSITGSAGRNIAFREPSYPPSGAVYVTGYLADVTLGYPVPLAGGMVLTNSIDTLVTSGLTSVAPTHTHPVTVNSFSGTTSSQSSSTTSAASSAVTGQTGTGDPISRLPASGYSRYIIRVL